MASLIKKELQFSTATYDPNNLIDSLIFTLGIKNDAALAVVLQVAPPVISKIRHKKLGVGPDILIRMSDVSGLSVNELRVMMGMPVVARYAKGM